MSGQRQKNRPEQGELAFPAGNRSDAPNPVDRGTETLMAKRKSESLAGTERLMEEVCELENCKQALQRVKANKGNPGSTSRPVKIPDYISPVVAHRVWRWDDTVLKSLNGEPWLPDRPVEARCRVAPAARHVSVVDRLAEVPDRNCTCGLYAAKNLEHLRQLGYASYGVCGEVYLWGIVVEHRLGWRAQFAYPKNLILPLSLLPFTLEVEHSARSDCNR